MAAENSAPSRCLIAFATGWGSQFGGINVFNTQFLEHLSFACQGQLDVVCVVPTATPEEVKGAGVKGVRLVPLPYAPAGNSLDASHAGPAIGALKEINLLPDGQMLVWLGHDRISGEIALKAKALAGGRSLLIHHMSYAHYEAYAENAASTSSKSELQKSLFREADVLIAIGPLLRDALRDMLPGKTVTMLVPGLDEITVRQAPRTFTGFMSGRLSADAAKVKQGHLGVAAFADAYRRGCGEAGLTEILKNQPRLILRGVNVEAEPVLAAEPDATDWVRFAEQYAGRVLNIHPLPYTTERAALLDELAGATVALMPSWHEGFGLAGWEAVAAGVPLILSQQSGLYQLLNEESQGAWTGWVYAVDVRGQLDVPYFRKEDLKAVSNRLVEIARDPATARDKAFRLREVLLSRFSWKQCVDSALASITWSDVQPVSAAVPAAPTPTVSTISTVRSAALQTSWPLEIPESRWQPGRGLADSQLLRPEELAVPFDAAREPELTKLMQWVNDTQYAQALRLITGSGGTGKSRLALELCARLASQGWHCGFVPSEIQPVDAARAWAALSARSEPVLAVFDYAETRQESLLAFVKAMLKGGATEKVPRVRFLLLARDGGEWWDRLPARDPLCQAFLDGYATSGPFALPPMHQVLEQREAAYDLAVQAYAARMGLTHVSRLRVDLAGEHFGRPLYIQMAALLALHGERPASAEGLTKALLHHERRYWARLLQDTAALSGLRDDHAAELMTLATLAGGFARPMDAQQAWKSWKTSAGCDLDRPRQRALFQRLAPLYPGQLGLQPLRPDLLGEALVAQSLLQSSGAGLLDLLLGPGTSSAQRQSVLNVLARLSNHRPDLEATVVQSLARSCVSCVMDLVNVSTQGDSLLPNWAEQAFANLSNVARSQALGLLLPLLKHESVQLAQLACAVSFADLEKHRARLDKKRNDIALQASYAQALMNHAVHLARAGRNALAICRESLKSFEELAAKNADQFEPGWAMSLNNYANQLGENGQSVEALAHARKALEICEKLATKNADRFEPDWATSLGNYAKHLSENGQSVEALACARKALEINEKLATKNADRFEPGWATSLNNYANYLSENGQFVDALACAHKALEIREKLATKNADRFEPDWATSLSNYANHLSENGQLIDALACALKALEIREKLATKNADRFEPDWATSLNNYANYLSQSGQTMEALACARKALDIHEKLATKNADRFAPEWAMSLGNYANRLSENGQSVDALACARKALEISEKLATKNADRFEPGWATSLGNYANHLSENGQSIEALACAHKALDIREKLATKNANRFEPDWATSLHNYANDLSANGQSVEALACARKALEIHEKLATRNADRFEPDWAMSLSNYANRLSENGRYVEALAYARKALPIHEKLATKNADRYEPDWAMSLSNYANLLSNNGHYVEALACAQRALDLTQRLVSRRPLRFAEDAYARNLAVQSFEWLVGDTGTNATLVTPDPDPAWCKPHRISALKIYRSWVTACQAGGDRKRLIAEILSIGNGLDAAQFRQVEVFWLCAAAWFASRAGETDREGNRTSQWLQIWRRFLAQHGGQYPRWMEEVAKRLDFVWPVVKSD